MHISHLISVMALTGSLGLIVSTADAQPEKSNHVETITVNCPRGESIQDAIDRTRPWKPLQLKIEGVCNEDVVITRDDVTLTGVGADAGITSTNEAPIYVIGGQRITIEHLTLSGGPEATLFTDTAFVTLTDVTLEGSGFNGIDAVDGSNIVISDSRVRNHALDGILIEKSGTLSMFNTIVSNNIRGGVSLSKGSSSVIIDSGITGNQNGDGVDVGGNSSADIKGSTTITGNGRNGVAVIMHSSVRIFNDPVVSGNGLSGIYLLDDAGVELVGAVTIGGNAVNAVQCADGESSIRIQDYANISQTVVCTGF